MTMERASVEFFENCDTGRRQKPHAPGGIDSRRLDKPRPTVYAAWKKQDIALARRAWRAFVGEGAARITPVGGSRSIDGPLELRRIVEVGGIGDDDHARR
ncbi:MAG: hypothetical protein QFF03_17375, partial [Pseudomonadota bacterium]|nr:hypothetical protein [Pseudomonadota bacterium]